MKRYLIFGLFLLAIAGCKKSTDNKPVVTDKKLLVSSEIDENAIGGVTATCKYWYDDNNRLIKSTSPAFQPGKDTINYTYDNNGNLTGLNYQGFPQSSVMFKYTNNLPVSTYLVTDPQTVRETYVVTNNKVTSILFATNGNADYTITYNGNNFNTITDNEGDINTYTYNDKKSAYYYSSPPFFLGNNLPYSIKGQNEFSAWTGSSPNFPQENGHFTVSSNYNSSGYPIKSTIYKDGTLYSYRLFNYVVAK